MGVRKFTGKIFWAVFLACWVALSWRIDHLDAAEPRGTLKIGFHVSLSSSWADPSNPSTYSSHLLLYLFHDALLKPMPDGMYAPCLAESWTISQDYRVYEFKLRPGVKFHNGDELTAQDVVFTFGRYKGVYAKFIRDRLEKVEALNPLTVRITFKNPFPNFLEYLLTGSSTIGWVTPKRYIEKVGEAEYRKHPVGCGPYKFVEFSPDVKIVAEAHKDFWRKMPSIRQVEIYTVPEISTRYAMVSRGELDIATLMQGVFYAKAKKESNLRVITPLAATRWIFQMTAQWDPKSPWSDPRVRKAASSAINRRALADIHLPESEPIGSIGLPGDSEAVSYPADPYDPERAKKLLAEAGYPKGFHGGKHYPQDGGFLPMGEQIANDLKAVGISLDIVILDRLAWSAKRRVVVGQTTGMTGGVFDETTFQPTIGGRFEYLFGTDFSYGNYPEIETLWEQYKKAIDAKRRKEIAAQIQKIIYDKTMFICLISNTHAMALGPRVKGNPSKIQPPKSCPIWWMCPFENIELNE
jgi:peptide/nickel transport system substrate-binding protein